jgi:predicted PurR-regulated permease PerM
MRPRTVVQITAIVLAMIALAGVIESLRKFFVILLVGTFIAIAVDPLVRLVERTGLKRGASVAVVLVTFFASVGTLSLVLGSLLVNQTSDFANRVPKYIDQLNHQKWVKDHQWLKGTDAQLQHLPVSIAQTLPTVAGFLANGLLLLLTMVALVTFLLLDGHQLAEGVVTLFPRLGEDDAWELARAAYFNVSRYVAGTTLECLINAVALAGAMLVLGVPFVLPMALIVFLLNYIPKVGSFLGMAPAIGLAWAAVGPGHAAWMALFVVVFQQIDGSFIYPSIMGRVINLSPMFVFLAALLGAQLLGVVGAVVAIPTAAVVHVALREYVRARNHGIDPTPVVLPSLLENESEPTDADSHDTAGTEHGDDSPPSSGE